MTHPPQFERYVDLFNRGEYFAAHEVLEDLWRERDADPFWQGLILFAAAFEKVRLDRARGARNHFLSTQRYLEPFLPGCEGIDVRPVVAHARRCAELLDAGVRPGDLPRFRMPPGELPRRPRPEPATDDEIRRAVEQALAGRRQTPSPLKEALLLLRGRAGRTRVEPVVREALRRGPGS